MNAAQRVCVMAWGSVLAAPWAAVATAVLVGTLAGFYHQGQVVVARREALAAVEREMARRRANVRGPFIRRNE
jgi:hypothetical protein